MTVRETTTTAVEQVKDVVGRAQRSRPARVAQRFTRSNGSLLAAGMAYRSLFAIFATAWVGFSIVGIWVRSNDLLYHQLIDLVNQAVPNLIGPRGAITSQMLDSANRTLSITGLIALVGLVWTALGWLAATRTAIRTIFGVGGDKRNFLIQKAIDAVQALCFGVGLVASALVALLTRQFLASILAYMGFNSHSMPSVAGVNAVSIVISLLINFGTLAAMYRILSRLYIPWRNLLFGSALGAIALSLLSQASSYLLRGASRNPLLASFAVFVALLLWFNLVCLVILFAAAWISIGMEDRGLSARRLSADEEELERARAEFQERLERARERVRTASAAYEGTRGWLARRRRRRELLHELRVLQNVGAGDPDRGR